MSEQAVAGTFLHPDFSEGDPKSMTLFTLLVTLIFLGVCTYLVVSFIPMQAQIQRLITTLVVMTAVFLVIVWLLQIAGFSTGLHFRIK